MLAYRSTSKVLTAQLRGFIAMCVVNGSHLHVAYSVFIFHPTRSTQKVVISRRDGLATQPFYPEFYHLQDSWHRALLVLYISSRSSILPRACVCIHTLFKSSWRSAGQNCEQRAGLAPTQPLLLVDLMYCCCVLPGTSLVTGVIQTSGGPDTG